MQEGSQSGDVSARPGVLLTGVTGTVGAELLPRLLRARPSRRLYCLVRPRPGRSAQQRLDALMQWAEVPQQDARRAIAVAGDITCGDLGLGSAYQDLAREVGEIFHAAADTRFDLDLEQILKINRDGAEHVIAFARRAQQLEGLHRLHHVSTAFVAGDPAVAPDASGRPHFRNTYEQSKWEAERCLRAAASEIPVTCYRPSIIAGDSRTGRILRFRVLYEPIKWVYLGGVTAVPCNPEARLDVVPVDHVCEAILALSVKAGSVGKTYHITSGPQRSIAVSEFVQRVTEAGHEWQRREGEPLTPPPRLVSPQELAALTGGEREKVEQELAEVAAFAASYLPYMFVEQLFDATETRQQLAGTGIECPSLRDYLRVLVYYASDQRYRDQAI